MIQLIAFLSALSHSHTHPPSLSLPARRCEAVDVFLFSHLGVFVHLGLILDAAGALCIAQRAECLVVVPVRGPHVGDHDRLGVTSQTILQEPSQLAITVRDVTWVEAQSNGSGPSPTHAFAKKTANLGMLQRRAITTRGVIIHILDGRCILLQNGVIPWLEWLSAHKNCGPF